MSTPTPRPKQFLFVDDDKDFLSGVREVFSEISRGSWEILTAENHAQALSVLQQKRMDVIVLDLNMPVMDGLQFLRLLHRTHPGQPVVIWTGHATAENRRNCLEAGAALFLEKLVSPDGFAAVLASLNALATAVPQEGFCGMMRRVGLHEVLQMECLGRKSSSLEVFTANLRGRIFICEGEIIHAESGSLEGEVALYALLGLRGGEFNLRPFSEPARRTISGQYEFLLMEAARLSDEGGQTAGPQEAAVPVPAEPVPPPAVEIPPALPSGRVRIDEVLLCSGAGEVLYEWECSSVRQRLHLLSQLEQDAWQLGGLLRAGRFDRMETVLPDGRIVCRVQPTIRLLVRSTTTRKSAAV